MSTARLASTPFATWRWFALLVGVGLALGLAAWFLIATYGRHPVARRDFAAEAVNQSSFLNVRSGVRYVGDAACAGCHAEQAESYAHHPMGRSFAAVQPRDLAELFPPFEKRGFRFSAERRSEQVIHRAERLDGAGRVLATTEVPAEYVLGSGTRGRSYLFRRGDHLFQSPVSWFTQSESWDLSPGFEAFYPPEAPVEVSCLFCHVNRAEAVPHTRNRYRAPVFDGLAIGCERCHGPGEKHVEARERGDAVTGPVDVTIVNPRHLPPLLREGVCQQCHLQGEKRLVRQGHEPFDYRPGLPLHLFWSFFVRGPEGDLQKAVGHVEQMHQSRCYRASNGQLGCASCHDPHRQPAPAERGAFYRGRCLQCHAEKPCTLPAAVRREQSPEDSCVQCHMPRFPSSNIAHTAVTDHRVPRRTAAEERPTASPKLAETTLVNFFQKELDPQDAGAPRDLGVALMQLARQPGRAQAAQVRQAVPLLETAVKTFPQDAEAWEAHGLALALLGRDREALAAWEKALKLAPERETTLALAAQALEQQGHNGAALNYARRLVAVNPWNDRARAKLAHLLGSQGDWPGALQECEAAVAVNPAGTEARRERIVCYLRLGDRQRAEEELAILLRLQPWEQPQIRSWFAEQANKKPP
jgi:Tfp pilus assembly protein PilF